MLFDVNQSGPGFVSVSISEYISGFCPVYKPHETADRINTIFREFVFQCLLSIFHFDNLPNAMQFPNEKPLCVCVCTVR